MKQWDDDDLDRFLDTALHEYSRQAPREGLEQRILSNLSAAAAPRRRWWPWALVPASAAILIVAAIWWPRTAAVQVRVVDRRPTTPAGISAIAKTAPAVKEHLRPAKTVARAVKTPRPEHNTKAPRLPTFPSWEPDLEQARMMLRFVQQHPDEAAAVVREQEEFRQLAAVGNQTTGSE